MTTFNYLLLSFLNQSRKLFKYFMSINERASFVDIALYKSYVCNRKISFKTERNVKVRYSRTERKK